MSSTFTKESANCIISLVNMMEKNQVNPLYLELLIDEIDHYLNRVGFDFDESMEAANPDVKNADGIIDFINKDLK